MPRKYSHGTATLSKVSEDMLLEPESKAYWDLVRRRLNWLEAEDRLLLELHLNFSVPLTHLAKVHKVNIHTLYRRIRRLTHRLIQGNYVAVRHYGQHLSLLDRQIAYDCFIQGLGYRRIVQKRAVSDVEARKTLRRLRIWCSRQTSPKNARRKKPSFYSPEEIL